MKTALIFGGGSKFGLALAKSLADKYHVTVITGSDPVITVPNLEIIKINWTKFGSNQINKILHQRQFSNLDLVVFNQNSSQGPNSLEFFDLSTNDIEAIYKNWLAGYRTDVMLPYFLIKRFAYAFNQDTKFCWMFSSLINKYISDPVHSHAGYRGFKITNFGIMQSFAAKNFGIYFGIDPGHMEEYHFEERAVKAKNFLIQADRFTNGQVFSIESNSYWNLLRPDPISLPN